MCIKTSRATILYRAKKEKKSTVNCITITEKWPKLRVTNQKKEKSKTMKKRCNINCTTHRNVIYCNTKENIQKEKIDIKVHTHRETLKL